MRLDITNPVKKTSGSITLKVVLFILSVILIGYVVERLYVTTREEISSSIDQVLSSTTNEQIDRIDRFFHDQFFETNPPPLLRRVLRRQDSDQSGEFSRERLQSGLRHFFNRTDIKRHVVTNQELTINKQQAKVKLSVLTFFNADSSKDRIERKFLSTWTVKLTRSDGRWQITNLAYRN